MWSAPSLREPVEKIRKAQWTEENTRQTRKVVQALMEASRQLRVVTGRTGIVDAIELAVDRFRELDPNVSPPRKDDLT